MEIIESYYGFRATCIYEPCSTGRRIPEGTLIVYDYRASEELRISRCSVWEDGTYYVYIEAMSLTLVVLGDMVLACIYDTITVPPD